MIFSGYIRESQTLGSTRRIQEGYQSSRIAYNNNKALFDQHNLDDDLKELAGYVWSCVLLADGFENTQNYT